MNETEELKKGAEESKARQVVGEVSAYLDVLTARIDKCEERRRSSTAIYWIVWAAWVIVGFFEPRLLYLFLTFFAFAIVYDSIRLMHSAHAMGEFFGAIETLRILGFVNTPDPRTRKRKNFFEEGISLVKKWATHKKEVQEKAYSPA